LRVEKVGSCLATVVTLRLPEAGGGEGWSWRGREGLVVVAASAKEAWWAAARWLRRALALAPRCRRRLPGAGGKIGVDVDVEVEGEAWLCATSVPKDVAWASRRDLLLCADTEEM